MAQRECRKPEIKMAGVSGSFIISNAIKRLKPRPELLYGSAAGLALSSATFLCSSFCYIDSIALGESRWEMLALAGVSGVLSLVLAHSFSSELAKRNACRSLLLLREHWRLRDEDLESPEACMKVVQALSALCSERADEYVERHKYDVG